MDNFSYVVKPMALQDARYVQLAPDNQDVQFFHIYKLQEEPLPGETEKLLVRELPVNYFKGILSTLDNAKFDTTDIFEITSRMIDLVIHKFPMVSNYDLAKTVIQYWAETYQIFHPGAQQ